MVNILLSLPNFHHKWARKIQDYINPTDRIAIIPFSFNEKEISNAQKWEQAYDSRNGDCYDDLVTPFKVMKLKTKNQFWINYFKHSIKEMKEIIQNCDIVYLPGGFPDKAVERIAEKKLFSTLLKAKVVIGFSAGALIQLPHYFLSPDRDYPQFTYQQGLGLVKEKFYIEVHYVGTQRQDKAIKKVHKEKTLPIYGISDRGAIIIDNKEISLAGKVVTMTRKT